MADRGDVFAAWVAENNAREEARGNMLPPPESTIANDLALYGSITTASQYESSRRAAEEAFDAQVRAAQVQLDAQVQAARADAELKATELEAQEQTLAEREAALRTSATSADVSEIEREQERAREAKAAAEKTKRNTITAALVAAGIAWAVWG